MLIQRNVTQEIRSLHSAIRTARLNVESLEASLESTKDALDATRLGYELSSRNLIDFYKQKDHLQTFKIDYLKLAILI